MLMLSFYPGEVVLIEIAGARVRVALRECHSERSILSFEAPPDVRIRRERTLAEEEDVKP